MEGFLPVPVANSLYSDIYRGLEFQDDFKRYVTTCNKAPQDGVRQMS